MTRPTVAVGIVLFGLTVGLINPGGVQAQTVVVNGVGSSSGREFAGLSPVFVCDTSPTPMYFKDSKNPPDRTEWQCKRGGVSHVFRFRATNSSNGYLKQPNGAVNMENYLLISGCPAGFPTTISGITVLLSVCPDNIPTQTLPVHWGGSDVKASSLHQTAFGQTIGPPANGHLTTIPTRIVPFSIVVGGNVRGRDSVTGNPTTLLSMTQEEIRQVLAGNVTDWTQLGFTVSAGSTAIVTCQRTVGSGALAALDEIIMRTKFWSGGINGTSSLTNISNAEASFMKSCVENHSNAIGYLDSNTVPHLLNGAYQVAISGMNVNQGAVGTGLARLKDLRCGKYPYWTDWNFITRNAGVEVAPVSAIAGTNAAITALGDSMLNNNPLPDFWLSENDTFVFKNDDRGPFNWLQFTNSGTDVTTVCKYTGSAQ